MSDIDKIVRDLARNYGQRDEPRFGNWTELEATLRRAMEIEREECVQIAARASVGMNNPLEAWPVVRSVIEAIRARGKR